MTELIDSPRSAIIIAAGLLIIIAPFFLRVVQEFLRTRVQLKEIERKSEDHRAALIERGEQHLSHDPTISTPDRYIAARNVVDTNFALLEEYYEQTLGENRLLSRAAVGVALLGFFVILIGVSLAFAGYTSVGVVSSVAGLLAEAATLMFFNQLREQVRQVQDYHKKLISTQYLMTAIALTENLGEFQEFEISRILSNLLFLSNELHGAKSDHLFDRTTPLDLFIQTHREKFPLRSEPPACVTAASEPEQNS
jgi:hypothetical protein